MQSYPPPPDQTPPGGGSVPPPSMGQTPPPGSVPSLPGYEQWGRPDPYAPTASSSNIVPASPLTPPPPPGPGQTLWPTTPTAGGPPLTQTPRRSLTWLWIIALVVVFLAGLGLGDVIGTLTAAPKANNTASRSAPSPTSTALSSTDATATAAAAASSSSTTTAASPTATPASSSSSSTTSSSSSVHHKVGETVTFNNVWRITVNSVQTSPGQGFDQPKAGDQYLLLDVTLVNISNSEQHVASSFNFTLRDTEGREIEMAFVDFASPPPSGKVEPQQKIRGTLPYEVPQSQHDFVLSFTDIMESGQLFWDIHV